MSLAILFGVFSIGATATLAAQSWPLSRAPGLEDLRWFSLAALTGSLGVACDMAPSLSLPDALVPWAGRLQIFFLGLHVGTWWAYASAYRRRPLGRGDRAVAWGIVLVGFAALVPGVLYGSRVHVHEVPWLGATYRSAEVGAPSVLVFTAIAAVPAALGVRFALARRSGVPYAGTLAAAFLAGTSLGVHDAVVISLGLSEPHLLVFGHVIPILVAAWANMRRHAREAGDLHRLRLGLERAVEERTRKLENAQAALLEAEKAAAVGHFSAKLAHEMNSPAAAVAANLRYVLEHLEGGSPLPHDALVALRDSDEAMARVAAISRELVRAARSGTATADAEPDTT